MKDFINQLTLKGFSRKQKRRGYYLAFSIVLFAFAESIWFVLIALNFCIAAVLYACSIKDTVINDPKIV